MPTPTDINTAVKTYSKQLIVEAQKQMVRVGDFSMNFSTEAKEPGESVIVQLSTANAAGDWNETTNNFKRAGKNIGTRSVPLNKRKIAGCSITASQMANFQPYWWQNQGTLDARSVGLSIVAEAAALITPKNFGDTAKDKLQVSLDGFGNKAVAKIRQKAIDDKNLTPEGCVLVLNSSYFSELLGTLDANVYGGQDAIKRGAIPGLLGFTSVNEWPGLQIPGFVASRAALALAGRRIPFVGTKPYELVREDVEPTLGLPLTTVILVTGEDGSASLSVNAMFGVGVGADDQLLRLIA